MHSLFRVRYWRTYPWPLQLLMLVLLVFTIASLFGAIAMVALPALTGHQVMEVAEVSKDSPRSLINAALLLQAISTGLGIFLIPALLYAYLSHPQPMQYLGLRRPGKWIQLPLAVGTMLGATPLFLGIDALMRKLLPASPGQEVNDRLTQAFLQTDSLPQLLVTLFVVALLPALGEELFFRGILYRFVSKKTTGIWLGILASAAFFAAIHFNPAGMIAIFLGGVFLALFYYLTGSIWTSILAHFVYNGSQALLLNLASKNASLKALAESTDVPLSFVLAGLVLFSISFYLLWKNRTPLPSGWAADDLPREGYAL